MVETTLPNGLETSDWRVIDKHEEYKHVLLFVDGWSVKSVYSDNSENYLV